MLTNAAGCELDVQRGPDWLIVRVGNIDLAEPDAPALAEQIWDLLEQHLTYRLVLELDKVQVLNSDLVGQLLQLYERIVEREGVMRLCGLSPYNRAVLHACRLDDRLLPYGDREEAVMGCPHPDKPR